MRILITKLLHLSLGANLVAPRYQNSRGQHGAHLGSVGPMLAPGTLLSGQSWSTILMISPDIHGSMQGYGMSIADALQIL